MGVRLAAFAFTTMLGSPHGGGYSDDIGYDDSLSGFVEFRLTDVGGSVHRFIEKVPVIDGHAELTSSADYPVQWWLACEIHDVWKDELGREVVPGEHPASVGAC